MARKRESLQESFHGHRELRRVFKYLVVTHQRKRERGENLQDTMEISVHPKYMQMNAAEAVKRASSGPGSAPGS